MPTSAAILSRSLTLGSELLLNSSSRTASSCGVVLRRRFGIRGNSGVPRTPGGSELDEEPGGGEARAEAEGVTLEVDIGEDDERAGPKDDSCCLKCVAYVDAVGRAYGAEEAGEYVGSSGSAEGGGKVACRC